MKNLFVDIYLNVSLVQEQNNENNVYLLLIQC